jgi:hypothetical protein
MPRRGLESYAQLHDLGGIREMHRWQLPVKLPTSFMAEEGGHRARNLLITLTQVRFDPGPSVV